MPVEKRPPPPAPPPSVELMDMVGVMVAHWVWVGVDVAQGLDASCREGVGGKGVGVVDRVLLLLPLLPKPTIETLESADIEGVAVAQGAAAVPVAAIGSENVARRRGVEEGVGVGVLFPGEEGVEVRVDKPPG